jgi:AcrR family transcriptional regulator
MPRRSQPLNRARIVQAAVELADAEGIESLSMRTLAKHFRTGAMSLYNHVDNKDDLIDHMVEHVAGNIELPATTIPWRPAVRSLATSTRDTLLRHPWAPDAWSARLPGPQRWRLMEAMLAPLATAGLTDHDADLGFHALINHVFGWTRQHLAFTTADATTTPHDVAANLDADEFPNVIAHLEYHEANHHTDDAFDFVLDLLLDAIDHMARAT